jgi:uncharacterized repeat protein (TIGR01451 family)/MYXO-CTERM domain-containing protein
MRNRIVRSGLVAALVCASAGAAEAAPALRVQVDQHGDFLLIGNTLGVECDVGTPAPVVGTIAAGSCNQTAANVTDTGPDLFWRSDAPGAGQALADLATTAAQARSTAVLSVPPGAAVTHAFLYWAAKNVSGLADTQVTVDRPGVGGFTQAVTAVQSFVPGVNSTYQSVADVTALVQANGSGPYRVSDIDVEPFANVNDTAAVGGWAMVVLYQRAGDPLRNLAIFDGLDVVANGMNQSVNLSGFLVPNAGYTGKLGVIAYEGDNAITGDQLFFNGGTPLTDAQNPPDNFFNSTRSFLGAAVSVAGDLPQLTGTAQSMGGLDLDVIDVTAKLTPGQTSAPVQATSTGDVYYLGCFITSVSTFRPDFTTSAKTAVDVNGGTLIPGDVLQYTIVVTNTGNDASKNTVLTDPLPTGVTFVPGSLKIDGVPRTDQAGDDPGDYAAGTRTVTARLGAGATAAAGGSIAINGTSTVTFQVTVDAGALGNIQNQAVINAGGLLGAPPANTPTDGNGPAGGAPPTTVVVAQCATNAQCAAPTPVCDTVVSPAVCVGCLADSDCGGVQSGVVCNTATLTCVPGCRGAGGNGCPVIDVCTSPNATIGQCVQCLVDATCGGPQSGTVCNTATDTCVAGCRGMGGNGCPIGLDCTSLNATIGQCVQCVQDSDCGGVTSGKVCNTATDTCQDGCRGTGGNGCPTGLDCTSMNAIIGACVQCLQDSDCGGVMSGKVCDATHACVNGCRGAGGNGCPTGDVCTSMDMTVGACVQCNTDADCGAKTSGKVCDAATSTCADGCRGAGGNGCPTGDVCTSMDMTVGTCVQCNTDNDCGGTMSGQVCDATTSTCGPGCRGTGGNGCPTSDVCTSKDATIGDCVQCLTDSDCGGAMSGKVCDAATSTCVNGCRGAGGNGCPDGKPCTSMDMTIGSCIQCAQDGDCGSASSGMVCDATTGMCANGCRGKDGNGCPTGEACTSVDATIGGCVQCVTDSDCGDARSGKVCTDQTCVDGCRPSGGNGCPDGETCTIGSGPVRQCSKGFVAEGNGVLCNASARPGDASTSWLWGAGVTAMLGLLRRRRRR